MVRKPAFRHELYQAARNEQEFNLLGMLARAYLNSKRPSYVTDCTRRSAMSKSPIRPALDRVLWEVIVPHSVFRTGLRGNNYLSNSTFKCKGQPPVCLARSVIHALSNEDILTFFCSGNRYLYEDCYVFTDLHCKYIKLWVGRYLRHQKVPINTKITYTFS